MRGVKILFCALVLMSTGFGSASAHSLIAERSMPSDAWVVFKVRLERRALVVPKMTIDAGPSQSMEGLIWLATADGSNLNIPGYPTEGSSTTVAGYYTPPPSSKMRVSSDLTGDVIRNDAAGPEKERMQIAESLPPLEPGEYHIIYVATSSFGRSWTAGLEGTTGVTLVAESFGSNTFHDLEDAFSGTVHASQTMTGWGALVVTGGEVRHEISHRLYGLFLAYSYGAGRCDVSMNAPGGTLHQRDGFAVAEFKGTPAGTYSFRLDNCVGVFEEVRLWGADVVLP